MFMGEMPYSRVTAPGSSNLSLDTKKIRYEVLVDACFLVWSMCIRQPREAIRELLWWLKAITRSEARRCDALVHQGSQLPAQLLARARARFGKDHEV